MHKFFLCENFLSVVRIWHLAVQHKHTVFIFLWVYILSPLQNMHLVSESNIFNSRKRYLFHNFCIAYLHFRALNHPEILKWYNYNGPNDLSYNLQQKPWNEALLHLYRGSFLSNILHFIMANVLLLNDVFFF